MSWIKDLFFWNRGTSWIVMVNAVQEQHPALLKWLHQIVPQNSFSLKPIGLIPMSSQSRLRMRLPVCAGLSGSQHWSHSNKHVEYLSAHLSTDSYIWSPSVLVIPSFLLCRKLDGKLLASSNFFVYVTLWSAIHIHSFVMLTSLGCPLRLLAIVCVFYSHC